MQNQTKELTEKKALTPELAREFDALVPLMQRLYDVLKPHSWDNDKYFSLELQMSGFSSVSVEFLAYAKDHQLRAGSVNDLFKQVVEFDPAAIKKRRLLDLKSELATLQTELAEVV